jgi:hypothetical protein
LIGSRISIQSANPLKFEQAFKNIDDIPGSVLSGLANFPIDRASEPTSSA